MNQLETNTKIVVHVKAVGNAPMLKNNKFKINGNEKFSKLINYLSSQLKSHMTSDSLVS